MKFKFKFLTFNIVIVVIVSIIILSEFTLRMIGLGDPLIYEPHQVWKYSLAQNQIKKRFKNNIVKINNAGLRGNREWVKSDEKLVLFMGDSVTYGGSRIDNKNLFSEKVCDQLGKNFICGNAGVNGYGILNIVLRSRYDDRIANADIVVFTIILDDFLRGLVDIKNLHYFTSPANKFLPATEEVLNWIAWSYDINRYLKRIPPRKKNEMRKKTVQQIEKEYFDVTEFALDNLNKEILRLISKKKEVFVFLSPSKKDVNDKNSEILKKIKQLVLSKTMNIYDMTTEFKKNKKNKIYMDDLHYDPYGHDFVSKIIYKQISKKIKK